MARRPFTRRMTPGKGAPDTWLVYIGADCAREEWVTWPTPDEAYVRRVFRVPPDVPLIVGRA